MKKLFCLAVLGMMMVQAAFAQPQNERRDEKIKAYRAAVFTQVLNLTSEEAEAFWPIYNDFLDKKDDMNIKPGKDLDSMTDAELEEQLKRHFENRQREIDLEKEMVQKLRKVLPIRKLAKLPRAEREFRESVVKKAKEARENRRGKN